MYKKKGTTVDNILINAITNELVLLYHYQLSICLYFGLFIAIITSNKPFRYSYML